VKRGEGMVREGKGEEGRGKDFRAFPSSKFAVAFKLQCIAVATFSMYSYYYYSHHHRRRRRRRRRYCCFCCCCENAEVETLQYMSASHFPVIKINALGLLLLKWLCMDYGAVVKV